MVTQEGRRRRLHASQEGAVTLEYIVIAAVFVLGLVAAIGLFKDDIAEAFDNEGQTFVEVSEGEYSQAEEHE